MKFSERLECVEAVVHFHLRLMYFFFFANNRFSLKAFDVARLTTSDGLGHVDTAECVYRVRDVTACDVGKMDKYFIGGHCELLKTAIHSP